MGTKPRTGPLTFHFHRPPSNIPWAAAVRYESSSVGQPAWAYTLDELARTSRRLDGERQDKRSIGPSCDLHNFS